MFTVNIWRSARFWRALPNIWRSARFWRTLPLGFMAVVVVITYAAIAWTLRRGFDWTDEAFVDTMISSNRQAIGEAWGFQHLLHPFYELTGQSVLALRVARLAGYVLLSFALVAAARVVVRRMGLSIPRSGWVFVLLLGQVGTFFAWSYPPPYLGYNELASWFAQLGVALIVLSLALGLFPTHQSAQPSAHASAQASTQGSRQPSAQASAQGWPSWGVLSLVWAGIGGLETLLVFAKVTSAAAFAALAALAIVVPNTGLHLWKRMVSVGVGAGGLLLVLWASGVPIGFYVKNTYSLASDKAVREAFGHPTAGMLTTYWQSLSSTGRALLPAVLLFGLAMVTFSRIPQRAGDGVRDDALDLLTWMFGTLLLTALIAMPKTIVWPYLGDLVVFIGAAAVIGLMTLRAGIPPAEEPAAPTDGLGDLTDGSAAPAREPAAPAEGSAPRTREPVVPEHGSARSRSLPVAVAALAVVAGPFISAVGTVNPIIVQFVFAATLWGVVLGVALVLLNQRGVRLGSRARALPALLGCLVVLLASLAVEANIARPYRTTALLSQQTSTSVPQLRGLLLTGEDAAWVDWVAAAGRSLKADGVPAIAINTRVNGVFNSSGALYAFNGSGYANPWLGRVWPAAFNSLRIACTTAPPADLFVLQPGTATGRSTSTIGVTKSFAACGIRFPGDFRVAARRKSADPADALTIWRLKPGWLAAHPRGS